MPFTARETLSRLLRGGFGRGAPSREPKDTAPSRWPANVLGDASWNAAHRDVPGDFEAGGAKRRARAGVDTYPPFLPEVADAAAQATAYRAYNDGLLALPFVVGQHWFQWQDQPSQGRGDGENQLIGIVDIHDELNQPLGDTIRDVNMELIERRLRLTTH